MSMILASASPRRKELLSLFRIPFEIRVADIDETMDPQKAPFDEVARPIPSWSAKARSWASPTAPRKLPGCSICCPVGITR